MMESFTVVHLLDLPLWRMYYDRDVQCCAEEGTDMIENVARAAAWLLANDLDMGCPMNENPLDAPTHPASRRRQ